jgi:hypothetical protein
MSQITHTRFSRNRTLFGLRTNAAIRICYSVEIEDVTEIIGLNDVPPEEIEISDLKGFNLPQYISIAGIPYFPSKYEFSEGDVWYHSRKPPVFKITIVGADNIFNERAKVMKARITPEMLIDFDKSSKVRPRSPSQLKIMGESAGSHAQRLVDNGQITIPSSFTAQWHWCHLIAFTMLPTHRAQITRNLVVGSSACNGHMANIEAAIKLFIYETKRPVSLEVVATTIADTHLGKRIRFRMWEQKSQTLFTDYFDALTEIRSDYADFENIYKKLMSKFELNVTS